MDGTFPFHRVRKEVITIMVSIANKAKINKEFLELVSKIPWSSDSSYSFTGRIYLENPNKYVFLIFVLHFKDTLKGVSEILKTVR